MGRGRFFGQAAIAIATVAFSTSELLAQAGVSPLVMSLDFVTSVEADTNRELAVTSPGTTFEVTETLSFGLHSETSVQSLDFTVSGALRYLDDPDDGTSFDFDEPTFRLTYSREISDSSLTLSANYRLSDVSDAIDGAELDPDDLVTGGGQVAVFGASVNLQIGSDAPLGFAFDASWAERDYRDTTDPDLFDTSDNSIGVSASLRFSPVTQGTLSVLRTNSSADDAESTETKDTFYDFSVSHELRRALTLTGSLGYADRDTTEFGVLTTTSGLTGGIEAVQALRNGSVSAEISFDNSDEENKISLSVGRSMELRDGSLSASLTAVNGEDSGTIFLGTLDYTKSLANGELTAGLRQSILTDSDDDEVKLTELSLGYMHRINSVSGLSLDLSVSRSEDGGIGSAPETTRSEIVASYSRELTSAWDLSVGYRHRSFKEEGASTAKSDAVFLTMTRSLEFGL